MEYNYTETEMFDDLDNLRESGTATSKTAFIKKFSNNYDPDLLETIIKDIDLYLFIEKDIKESEFSNVDFENAIKRRLENGLEIPYYKNSKPTELTEKQLEIRKRLNSNANGVPLNINLTPRINLEELLFPFEFFIIYQLKNQITAKILELKAVQPQHAPTDPAPENEHPTIFVKDSFKLFDYIKENHIAKDKGRYADISFYYWKMYNDKLIIQKPFPFQDWFSETYNEAIGKIKTLQAVSNPDRLKHYSTSLDWFSTQNK